MSTGRTAALLESAVLRENYLDEASQLLKRVSKNGDSVTEAKGSALLAWLDKFSRDVVRVEAAYQAYLLLGGTPANVPHTVKQIYLSVVRNFKLHEFPKFIDEFCYANQLSKLFNVRTLGDLHELGESKQALEYEAKVTQLARLVTNKTLLWRLARLLFKAPEAMRWVDKLPDVVEFSGVKDETTAIILVCKSHPLTPSTQGMQRAASYFGGQARPTQDGGFNIVAQDLDALKKALARIKPNASGQPSAKAFVCEITSVVKFAGSPKDSAKLVRGDESRSEFNRRAWDFILEHSLYRKSD